MMLGVDGGWCGITVEQMNLSLLNYVRASPNKNHVIMMFGVGGREGGGGGDYRRADEFKSFNRRAVSYIQEVSQVPFRQYLLVR